MADGDAGSPANLEQTRADSDIPGDAGDSPDGAQGLDDAAEGRAGQGDQAADSGGDGASAADSGADGADGAPGVDSATDGGSGALGLVAFYPFDEASGTATVDGSGHARTATMRNATFAPGLRGNAATMNGSNQYVSLPDGIADGLISFSVCEWVKVNTAALHAHVVDFGTGTNAYLFLAPGTTALQFAITTAGVPMEQRLNTTPFGKGWHHVVVTLAGTTGTLYVDGAQVAQNQAMTSSPANLGNTMQNWLGRSQDSTDPYFNGQIDNFRLYDHALGPSEILRLFQGQL